MTGPDGFRIEQRTYEGGARLVVLQHGALVADCHSHKEIPAVLAQYGLSLEDLS